MGTHILDRTYHGAHGYWLCGGALRGDGSRRGDYQHTARCAVGAGGFCVLQSGSGPWITAATSGRCGCRLASTPALVGRDCHCDRRRYVVDRREEEKLVPPNLWSRVLVAATLDWRTRGHRREQCSGSTGPPVHNCINRDQRHILAPGWHAWRLHLQPQSRGPLVGYCLSRLASGQKVDSRAHYVAADATIV